MEIKVPVKKWSGITAHLCLALHWPPSCLILLQMGMVKLSQHRQKPPDACFVKTRTTGRLQRTGNPCKQPTVLLAKTASPEMNPAETQTKIWKLVLIFGGERQWRPLGDKEGLWGTKTDSHPSTWHCESYTHTHTEACTTTCRHMLLWTLCKHSNLLEKQPRHCFGRTRR